MNTPVSDPVVLSKLLAAKRIKLNLAGTTRDDVLQELVARISELADQPAARQTLLHALVEREQLHSTGIGDGIALPHARNALAGILDDAVIVFGRHPTGIAYGAVDGVPARLFFLIVAPAITEHLAILARISRLLRDEPLRQSLLAAIQPEEIVAVIREAEAKQQGGSRL
jgi:mannitol/fructose-specific phosphotransferase system IIA component (Ntr-type)